VPPITDGKAPVIRKIPTDKPYVFITMDDEEEYRRIEDWAVPLIDRRLEEPAPQIHASTDQEVAQLISEYSAAPGKIWSDA